MKKMTLYVVFCMIMSVVGNISVDAFDRQVFPDVPVNHWAYEYITDMAERGVICGYEDGTFQPDKPVTRAEAIKMLGYIEQPGGNMPDIIGFEDVTEDSWYVPYIGVCGYAFNEYIEHTASGKKHYFHPNNLAEREDIIVALMKQKNDYYNISNIYISKCEGFSDYWQISEEKLPYIESAVAQGILSGYDDNTIRPHGTVTRAEMATLLYKVYGDGNVAEVILENHNYTMDCDITEFITRYNKNCFNNVRSIENDENDNFIIEEMFINKIEIKKEENAVQHIDLNVEGINENKCIDFGYGNLKGKSKIYCDSAGKIIGVDWDRDIYKNNAGTFINHMPIYDYDCICIMMSLFDISYDEAKELLKAVQKNNFSSKFGDVLIYELNRYYNSNGMLKIYDTLTLGGDMGFYLPTENSGKHIASSNGTIQDFVKRYNQAVYANFKHITEDLREVSPENILISENSFFAKKVLSNQLYWGSVEYESDFYHYRGGGTGGQLRIVCNTKNEILYLLVGKIGDGTNNSDNKRINLENLAHICVIQALENISFEQAKTYYFSVINGSNFTLFSGNMYKQDPCIEIITEEYYLYEEDLKERYHTEFVSNMN